MVQKMRAQAARWDTVAPEWFGAFPVQRESDNSEVGKYHKWKPDRYIRSNVCAVLQFIFILVSIWLLRSERPSGIAQDFALWQQATIEFIGVWECIFLGMQKNFAHILSCTSQITYKQQVLMFSSD